MSGRPNEKRRRTEAVFGPMPSIVVSQSRASSAVMSPRNSSEWSPRCSRMWRSVAWIRGAFCGPRPPGRMTSMSSASGAVSTAAQSGADPGRQPGAAPAGTRLVDLRRYRPRGKQPAGASNAFSAFVSAVFWVRIVRISSLVGSRRRRQLGWPYRPASSSRTNGTTWPIVARPASPPPPGVAELALARPRARTRRVSGSATTSANR